MDDDAIELISDGDGVAVLGDSSAVERFLAAEGLESRELNLDRLGPAFMVGASAAQVGAETAAHSGRWILLTEKSANALRVNKAMKGSSPAFSRAIVTKNGKISGILEYVKSPAALAANPALLAGAAGIMAQIALEQALKDISDYLARIDEKVDDLLRAQKDTVLAEMIGVGFVIDEAMTIREGVGRVSEVTWSKVQGTSVTIARTQAYALRQLDALAEKLEKKSKLGDIADLAVTIETKAREWLAILARCFQLLDGLAILELDRVLDSTPDELSKHREALQTARRNRRNRISQSTGQLLMRLDTAARSANSKVLFHPKSVRSIVSSSNQVATQVLDFQELVGIETDREVLEAKRWLEAVADVRNKALESGAEGVDATLEFCSETLDRAIAATGKVAGGIAERASKWGARREDRADEG